MHSWWEQLLSNMPNPCPAFVGVYSIICLLHQAGPPLVQIAINFPLQHNLRRRDRRLRTEDYTTTLRKILLLSGFAPGIQELQGPKGCHPKRQRERHPAASDLHTQHPQGIGKEPGDRKLQVLVGPSDRFYCQDVHAHTLCTGKYRIRMRKQPEFPVQD